MSSDDFERDLSDLREPDPMRRAAQRIEAATKQLVPRMRDIELRQEKQEGEMATQRDLSAFEQRMDDKLEKFAHRIVEDSGEKTEKIVLQALKTFIETELGPHVAREVDQLEARRIEAREAERKAREAELEARRKSLYLRLTILLALISLLSTVFVVVKFALEWV